MILSIKKLISLVQYGTIRRYLLDNGIFYAKGRWAYVPSYELRRVLLKKVHDSVWVGHPDIERTKSLLARQFFWSHMDDGIEAYVQTCLVCQQDKVEQQQEPRLLQPLSILDRP